VGLLLSLALAGCVSPTDHFYTLTTIPDDARPAATPTIHVRLQVTVPSLVDRNEMVLSTAGNGIEILDHERWAAPLADQVSQTLARDIEARRPDIFVADRAFDQAGSAPVTVKVEIVRMSARRGGRAIIEGHWRIVDPAASVDELGTGSFEAAVTGDGYAAIAQAFSRALNDLAERLSQAVRRR
jgi:uncharacterized lipoprotein YmbA